MNVRVRDFTDTGIYSYDSYNSRFYPSYYLLFISKAFLIVVPLHSVINSIRPFLLSFDSESKWGSVYVS
jgi:hypothetical protein